MEDDFDLRLYGIDYACFYWTIQIYPDEPWILLNEHGMVSWT